MILYITYIHYMCVYTYNTCIHVYTYIYIYIYIYIHTYTYIHVNPAASHHVLVAEHAAWAKTPTG